MKRMNEVNLEREGWMELRRLRRVNAWALAGAAMVLGALGVMAVLTEVDVSVPAKGEVAPAILHEVVAGVEGQVERVHVEHGEMVGAGDPLLDLSNDGLEADLEEARAALETARSRRAEVEKRLAVQEEENREEIAQREAVVSRLEARTEEIRAGGDPQVIAVAEARLRMASIELEYAALELEKAETLLQKGVLQSKKRDEAENRFRLAEAAWEIAREQVTQAKNPYTPHDLARAEAELEEARHAAAESRARLGELDVYRGEMLTLERAIEETEVHLRHLERRREKLHIVSPVEGKVLTNRVERLTGRWVSAGELLLELGQGESFVVQGHLAEEYLPQVETGQEAKVYLRAFPFREYQVLDGELVELSERFAPGEGDGLPGGNGERVAPIRVALRQGAVEYEGEELPLRPGLSAEVEIIVRRIGLLDLLRENIQRWRSGSISS
jgi:multidrug resistance efflux pump